VDGRVGAVERALVGSSVGRVAEEPSDGQVDGKLSWRTQVVWATWLLGWIVPVASGLVVRPVISYNHNETLVSVV
jgi:hypothetical protein